MADLILMDKELNNQQHERVEDIKLSGESLLDIINEILYLYKEYNQKYFVFMDDLFTLKKEKVIDLCKKFKENNLIKLNTSNFSNIFQC